MGANIRRRGAQSAKRDIFLTTHKPKAPSTADAVPLPLGGRLGTKSLPCVRECGIVRPCALGRTVGDACPYKLSRLR